MKRLPLLLSLCILAGLVAISFLADHPVESADTSDRAGSYSRHTAQSTRSSLSPSMATEARRVARQGKSPAGTAFFKGLESQQLAGLGSSDEPVIKSILSRKAIHIDFGILADVRKKGGGVVSVDTGDQGVLTVDIEGTSENWGGGYSLTGGIRGFPLGTFIATVHGEALVAAIRTEEDSPGHFAINLNPEGVHELRRLDTSGLPSCDGVAIPKPDMGGAVQDQDPGQSIREDDGPPTEADDGSVIDVMVVYTPEARIDRGGTNGMIASINQTITESNQAFSASGVATAFRLAHSAELPYSETDNSSTDLTRLAGKTDGYLDEVHTLRNTYAADIVSLWVGSGYGGRGYLMTSQSNSFESSAFNVCGVNAAVTNYTFTHECGHNMGSTHDAENSTGQGLYSYSYGSRWFGSNGTQYRSIMAYAPGSRVPRFSNPSVTYSGGVTGSTSANNALSLNNARLTASNWRSEPSSPVFSVSPTSQSASTASGSYSFLVNASGTWSWTSSGGSGWLTTSEAATQSGNQTFSYSLAANTLSSSRTATITLTSGSVTRTHTVTQAGGTTDDHGNTTATATLISQNSTTGGNIGTAGDLDYFRINVSGSGTLVVTTTGSTDTFGTLLDSAGGELATNDDDETTNFRISYAVTAGTYYVQVRHYGASFTGAYQLVSSLTPAATLSLDPDELSVPAAGGNFSFDVTSNITWSWSDSASWLTSGEAVTQTGNQLFIYNVSQNTAPTSRTAVVTLVAGSLTRTHTVTQAGASTDDHGNTTATATLVSQNSTTSGNLEIGGDNDYFRINVTGSGTLTVGTTGTSDTYGHLLNSAGTQLASDDDAGISTNFSIVYTVSTGTYYVRVRHYNESSGIGAYQLVSAMSAVLPDDHGNTTSTATLVSQDSSTDGNLEIAGDEDFFRINATEPGTLVVRTTGNTDTYGYLLNSAGVQLASNDDHEETRNFLISHPITAGTYYVRVRHYSSIGTGAYQLTSSLIVPFLTVTPHQSNLAPDGSSVQFEVASNMNWSWSLAGGGGWLATSEAISQQGNHTFSFAAEANDGSAQRTATFTFVSGGLSTTHVVTQAGTQGPDDFSITAINPAGSDAQISFSTRVGKVYRIQSSDSLLSNSWTNRMTGINGTGGVITRTLNGYGTTHRTIMFFRVGEE